MQTNRAEQKAQEGADKLVWPRGVINLPDHVYRINMRGIDGFEPGRNSTQRDIVNPLRGGLSEVKRGDHPLKMLYHKIHKKPLTVADVSAALYSAPYHDENFSPLHSTLNLHAKNRIEILKTVLLFNQDVDRKFGKPCPKGCDDWCGIAIDNSVEVWSRPGVVYVCQVDRFFQLCA